jgi:MFS family permease
VSSNAPARLAATSQSLLTGFYEGLGTVLGTLVGGALYDRYGLRVTYRVASMTLFSICILFVFYQFFAFMKKSKRQSKELSTDSEQVESKFEIESAENEA